MPEQIDYDLDNYFRRLEETDENNDPIENEPDYDEIYERRKERSKENQFNNNNL